MMPETYRTGHFRSGHFDPFLFILKRKSSLLPAANVKAEITGPAMSFKKNFGPFWNRSYQASLKIDAAVE